jgi:hypothetical protein
LRKGKGDALKPQVIGHPATTAEGKELPLVLAHTHVLEGLVDDLRLAY